MTTIQFKHYLLLFAGYLWVAISFYYDDGSGTWFARSGAILVFFSVWYELTLPPPKIEEYERLEGFTFSDGSSGEKAGGKLQKSASQILEEEEAQKSRKFAVSVGYVTAMLGTIIWAYGDYLYQFVFSQEPQL